MTEEASEPHGWLVDDDASRAPFRGEIVLEVAGAPLLGAAQGQATKTLVKYFSLA